MQKTSGTATAGPIRRTNPDCTQFRGPTRLPRLPIDGQFGALTVARVMEFQSSTILRLDGVVGPRLTGSCRKNGREITSNPTRTGRSILADLYNRELTAYDNGNTALHISPISGGRQVTVDFRCLRDDIRRLRPAQQQRIPGQDNMDFSLSTME